MPLEGHCLVVEPRYPNADKLSEIGTKADPMPEGCTLRNEWWSDRERCHILIWDDNGKIAWNRVPGIHHFKHDLMTLGCADAWGIEQESNALQLLGTLVRHNQMKQYLLTGMFLETSKRSGLTYMFRKLKPTVVIDARPERVGDDSSILCALCMHPIAYYAGSWAGAMTPTDDVVAMLMLMRGDEHLLWRRANQHHPSRPEAGL